MDKRRLVFGSALLLIVVGLLLAALTPGGWFHSDAASASIDTPFGSVSIADRKSSPWPMIGYALMGLGGLGLVMAYAMKPSRGA